MTKYTLFLLLLPHLCLAQMFDNTWLLGYNNDADTTNLRGIEVVTFPDGSLHIRQNSALYHFDFSESNTSLSDSLGQLLSYSNGVHIGNGAWEIMENGAHITAALEDVGAIWPQWVLGLPMPGDADRQIYLYENERINTQMIYADSLFYAEISLATPGGKVVTRGNLLLADSLALGKMNAVKHANGRDWWVVVNENNTNGFYLFLLDPTGIKLVGKQHQGNIVHDGVGQSVFSPNGEHLAYINTIGASYGSYLDVYDFNRCTGALSNARQYHFTQDRSAGGCAFSPNSRYLYVNHALEAYQYDLTSPDIWTSRVQIAEYDGFLDPFSTTFYLMQLAPDGKIYSSCTSGAFSMHIIHQPDEAGLNCQYQQHGLKLITANSYSAPSFPNYRLGPLDGSSCDTLGLDNRPVSWWRSERDTAAPLQVYFHDLSYYEPTAWQWDFGDGAAGSAERHPEHTFPGPGSYEVCLTVSNSNASNTLCRTLQFGNTAAEDPALDEQLAVMPTPFDGHLSVSVDVQLRQPEFRLYDAMGRLALRETLYYGLTDIRTDELPAGIYIWEIRSGGVLMRAGKTVKMNEKH